jgi:hypothetical protein
VCEERAETGAPFFCLYTGAPFCPYHLFQPLPWEAYRCILPQDFLPLPCAVQGRSFDFHDDKILRNAISVGVVASPLLIRDVLYLALSLLSRIPPDVSLLPGDTARRNLFYGDAWRAAKDFDPEVLLETPPVSSAWHPMHARPNGAPVFATKLLGWPMVVILGQLCLQCLAWGFFIAVRVHGQIPLPLGAALWIKGNGHLVTLLSTLLATILAGLSSL